MKHQLYVSQRCCCITISILTLFVVCAMLNFTQLLRIFCVLSYLGYTMAWIGLVRTFPLAEQGNNKKRVAANATILDPKRSQVSHIVISVQKNY